MPRITFDHHGRAYTDGRPFFLLGARHMPEGGSPALLRDAGFNAYRLTAFGSETHEPQPPPPPEEGIYFWSYLYDRTVLDRSPDHEKQLRRWVLRVRDHPALLCYENYNEPNLHGTRFKAEPHEIERGTRLLRELDPDHPVWLAFWHSNTVQTLRRFGGCFDITGSNPYPVYVPGTRRHVGFRPDGRILDCPDQSIHAVGRYTEKMMRVADGKPVWMLIQAMANEHWYSPVHTPELAGQGIDPTKVRYPTYEQMRFMVFDAIVHGATGLAFALYRTPIDSDAWRDVDRLVGELRGLHDALCAPPVESPIKVEHEDLGFSIWDGVRATARRLGDTVYVFAINTAFDPARVHLTLPCDAESIQMVAEDQTVELKGDTVRDNFEPYGVHVYRVQVAESRT